MSDDADPISLDPNQVIAELLEMPEARPLWALAQERTARKQLQAQLAEAGRRLAELENAQAPTKPPGCGCWNPPVTVDPGCPEHGSALQAAADVGATGA